MGELGTVSSWHLTEEAATKAAVKEMKQHTDEFSFLVLKVIKRVDRAPEPEPVVTPVK